MEKNFSKPQITAMVVDFLVRGSKRQKKSFAVEKFRSRWVELEESKGYPTPHPNAWGSAWRIAKDVLKEQGYEVIRVDYTPAVSASTHRHPVANWQVKKVA